MRAAGLAAALLAAKLFALINRQVDPMTMLSPAWIWQDLAVVLLFFALDAALKRPRWLWIPYAVLIAWIVVNVAIVNTLGTPLTVTMLGAAGGPLVDSMRSAVTPVVLAQMGFVIAAAALVPFVAMRVSMPWRRITVAAAVVALAAGAVTAAGSGSDGLQRNALTSLLTSASSRVFSAGGGSEFRRSPFGDSTTEDLTGYRKSASGLNILLVILESTAARYLASYGAADDPTPSLTSLARESIVFESAYAAYPESVKGLFALLCGTPPAFDVPAEGLARSRCDSVVHHLKTAGYRTGLFHAGRFTYLGMQDVLDAQRFDTAEDAGAMGGRVESSFGVDEPTVVARVLDWIDRNGPNQPFFAVYEPVAGHHPYISNEPGPFPSDTTLGAYKNAIHEGDRALGTLVEGLRSRQLLDRTVVIVIGDHGQAFDQHPGNRVHSLFIYDENVHVPLIVRVPDRSGAFTSRRARKVASNLDVGPTILDLVGLPPQSGIQGASLLNPEARMALFHADYDRGWLGLRDNCWKYLLEIEAKRSLLFDVCSDRDETLDRSAGESARVSAYRSRVTDWAAAVRASVLSGPSAR